MHEPAGIVQVEESKRHRSRKVRDFSVMWQIEHNGPWEWEVGEDDPGLHIAAFGPEYQDHQWFTNLGEGNDFESVPVSFAIVAGDWQDAVAEMTLQRRALRAAKARELGRTAEFERTQGLVIYNDYMNTLFGDPRIDKELPLIEGAAGVGADIFCIDAGWYDSTDGGWWDMVGEWQASTNRFGEVGLQGLADIIREHGMGLGLWLEPEVIGVQSPLAKTLPDSAFFQRHGVRVCDSGRYLLDFRSPEARAHVTRTVDRLIDDFGAVFFKFDYNTIPGVGTDVDAGSAGEGLLAHCRAYLDWLDDLRRRHPDVMIENCGSGAMRADYAQLSRLDLQSTSDQCDPLVYAAIAAGAGLTIPPEQQGNWGYAQEEMNDETAVFTLATGVMGRLYLSGSPCIGEFSPNSPPLCRSGPPVCLVSTRSGLPPACAIRKPPPVGGARRKVAHRIRTLRLITSSSGVEAAPHPSACPWPKVMRSNRFSPIRTIPIMHPKPSRGPLNGSIRKPFV